MRVFSVTAPAIRFPTPLSSKKIGNDYRNLGATLQPVDLSVTSKGMNENGCRGTESLRVRVCSRWASGDDNNRDHTCNEDVSHLHILTGKNSDFCEIFASAEHPARALFHFDILVWRLLRNTDAKWQNVKSCKRLLFFSKFLPSSYQLNA